MKNRLSSTRHFETFLELRGRTAPASVESIQSVAKRFVTDREFLQTYNFTAAKTSLLVGQVQSGKTGHYLGIAAAVADTEDRFSVFVLLTQSLVALQQQTLLEAKTLLTTFDVFDENDEMSFRHSLKVSSRPKLLVLKKTKKPLTEWQRILSPKLLGGRPLFIIDDEADATGLNTKVNKSEQSEINRLMSSLVGNHASYLLQVTATPHAVLLQENGSTFRPQSHLYFLPGPDYLGGNFFFPSVVEGQTPYVFKATNDRELADLQDASRPDLPDGARMALFTFMLTAAFRIGFERDRQCNFLLHPSANTFDHGIIRDKVKRFVLEAIGNLDSLGSNSYFVEAYKDLKKTKPQLPSLNDLLVEVRKTAFNVVVMNSGRGNLSRSLPNTGANIFIGGNVLSRGIVVPRLQTIYYCRKAQRIQLDTYWQHSRAFGYDRDPAMVRMFMPQTLYANFVQMNESIQQLFAILADPKSSELQVVTPRGIAPTRSNVVLDLAGGSIVGGVNHFPVLPNQENYHEMDKLLSDFDESDKYSLVSKTLATTLLKATKVKELGGIGIPQFLLAVKNLKPDDNVVLIVRRNRAVSQGTGTLLSPTDRQIVGRFPDLTVMVFYEITGDKSKGWIGRPFWIPNVKLPGKMMVYYRD